jgi:8-oxo-dGTP pyrophosphatase MutT (NUDIX family)
VTKIRAGVVEVLVLAKVGDVLQALLMRRAAGTRCTGAWESVHGRIEGVERPEEAAVREVREETGLEIRRMYNVHCLPFYLHRDAVIQLSVVFAALVDPDSSPRLSAEHDAAEWLGVDAALERFSWPRTRQALRDAASILASGDAGPLEDVLRVI